MKLHPFKTTKERLVELQQALDKDIEACYHINPAQAQASRINARLLLDTVECYVNRLESPNKHLTVSLPTTSTGIVWAEHYPAGFPLAPWTDDENTGSFLEAFLPNAKSLQDYYGTGPATVLGFPGYYLLCQGGKIFQLKIKEAI